MIRLNLWFLPRAFLYARGPWVRPSPGIPCALLFPEGRSFRKARATSRRGTADLCPHELLDKIEPAPGGPVAVIAVPNQGWGAGPIRGADVQFPRKHTERCKS